MLLDLCIILLVAATVYRSWGSGFVRQFLGSAGFFGGLLLGRLIEPQTIQSVHSANGRAVVTILTVLGAALVGLGIGEYAGLYLKRHLLRFRINRLDNSLGSALTAVSVLLSIWLLAAIGTSLPANALQTATQRSHIISLLNHVLPPAPTIIADLGRLVDPNGFPDVFIGVEPIPRGNVDLPALGDMAGAVNAARKSVVRLQGQGCGGIVSGSGFVVGNGLVATNAHVVAGIRQQYVEDANGTHKGKVVLFDPKLDFAVLRVTNLAGKPLALNGGQIADKTPGAVLGYPGGGGFDAGAAAVIDRLKASGHDIYGNGHTIRDIYEIKATVIPGNSGGPLIGQDGRVMGVVFAESTTYEQVGYTLTMPQVISEIQQASGRSVSVGTGSCAE
jgi:S1-C subfamily serine protease